MLPVAQGSGLCFCLKQRLSQAASARSFKAAKPKPPRVGARGPKSHKNFGTATKRRSRSPL
jgi:hypothetical protein